MSIELISIIVAVSIGLLFVGAKLFRIQLGRGATMKYVFAPIILVVALFALYYFNTASREEARIAVEQAEKAEVERRQKEAEERRSQRKQQTSTVSNGITLSNTGQFIITLRGPDDVREVKLKADVSPEWRVIDLGREVKVRIFDLEAGNWSGWSTFKSATTARYIPDKKYTLIEFKAPALSSNETVRIVVIGARYGAT